MQHLLRLALPLAFLGSACGAGCSSDDSPPPARVEEAVSLARQSADRLGQQLMAALQSAIADSGPVGAIDVCRLRAPSIAQSLAQPGRLEIGRTAERLRNPVNAPDAWESKVLAQFALELQADPRSSNLEAHKLEPTADGWRLRWMRPIALLPMCAMCHGQEIEPALAAELARLYPEDSATGFAPGDLRGAFTASVTIPR